MVGCSHGTDDPAGRAAVSALLAAVAAARPELDVREAFVDVQEPEVADVVAAALAERAGDPAGAPAAAATTRPTTGRTTDPAGGPAPAVVVVPLLLSVGYHVKVDIAAAVDRPGAAAAAPLGPDPRLVDLLTDRLLEAGLRADDAVVLAAAGSSDAAAALSVEATAAGLADRLPGPVTIGYGAGARPRVPEAVATARGGLRAGGRVVVASYLLAPGYFHDRVLEAGADVVAAPLAGPDETDPRLVAVVLDRFDAACAAGG
ncbi:sirohydrochlorin chelatase [Cellulomonas alba]|uniref:CbiX/SirB N-terminal domain-containing protein n=1 Tax=Cellulomonas alba TaxID=3053467 RepID=A0ABT7SD32_9CELL|nr:CbiX/SirB N-terminal domain-containing protein [Cellulomonas alba]MDM7854085.1 CbiX/SirB N-terminal domain-containing protein [Cellulomonas alba]